MANDLCGSATEVGAGKSGVSLLTVRATTSPDDPESACGCGINSRSVWYRLTPPSAGTVRIDTFASRYYPVVSVFSGDCGTLRRITCDDPAIRNSDGSITLIDTTASVSFTAKAGESYYVEVASFCGFPADRLEMQFDVPGGTQPVGDPFTEVFSTPAIDLDRSSLTFTPAGGSYSVCGGYASAYPTDPTGGTQLDLGDDSFASVSLTDGKTVALYGQSYGQLFVSENGYVTFGAGSTAANPSFESHLGALRVAPLFTDLLQYPPAGGNTISWKQVSDRVAITWDGVYSFDPVPVEYPRNSFQLELFFDGSIRMTLLDVGAFEGLTGLSAGGAAPRLFPLSNFSAAPNCSAPAGGELSLGGRLALRDSLARPEARSLRLALAKPAPSAIPAPGSAGDPTVGGAQLDVFNPTTGEFETMALPAQGWTTYLSPSGTQGYRYRDRDVLGPCSRADLAVERGVRVRCGGTAMGFTLNEARQGTVAASLTVGSTTTGRRFCGVFGGSVRADSPATPTRTGVFRATGAPPPDRCLLPY